MKNAPPTEDAFDLGWHREWIVLEARAAALQAYVELGGSPMAEPLDDEGLRRWERSALRFACLVRDGLNGIEEPEFVECATCACLAIFLHRLWQLDALSGPGGRA